MLLRISLIVAIIAGLVAGSFSYIAVSDKIPALQKQRDDEQSAKKTALGELAQTKTELGKTKSDLAQTQQELASTKVDRDNALARAEVQAKHADELTDKLDKVTKERDNAQNELASYKATDLTPEQVVKLNKNLKDAKLEIEAINGEKAVISRRLALTKARLLKYEGEDPTVKFRADLRGKIIVVDPKWDFVILNIGEDQGVLADGELLVSREGRLVAKVVVRSVQKDRCIANVVPGWKIGEPIEGDEVCPAHPAS